MDNKTILRELWRMRMIFIGATTGYVAKEFILDKYMSAIPLAVCMITFFTIMAYIDFKICKRVEAKKEVQ